MAAQANIVINDGAGTPAARTFVPEGTKSVDSKQMKATWRENAGAFLGRPTIEEYFTPPNANGVQKLKHVISLPVLQTVGTNDAGITPVPEVAYTLRFISEVHLPVASTDTERSHIRAFAENFLATSMWEDLVENMQRSWA